jgi:O6-methylguanine-DNA--protein-cysteine methyltransferase
MVLLPTGVIENSCVSYEVNTMTDQTTPTTEQVESLMARVFALVKACPVGSVTTYGALAKTIGYPRGARMVG